MILVAPTSFKGTLGAADVSRAVAAAAGSTNLDILELPVSDGGPGLIDALRHVQGGTLDIVRVTGPHRDSVDARILVQNGRAVIESADACGIHLTSRRDPINATTYGVGELLRAGAERARHIIIGLGGSATVDGGVGMVKALADGLDVRVTALADVRNPLVGPNGAARVFGPQKGASPEQVRQLDDRLTRLAADIVRVLGVDVASMEGGGAAGGLGAGLRAFANADVVRGSEWVLNELDFDRHLARATVLITGEGAFDAQSSMGKITGTLIERAADRGVPVLLVAGSVSGALPAHVHAATGAGILDLPAIQALVRIHLPRLLSA